MFATYTFRDPAPVPGSPGYTSVGHAGAVRALERYARGLAEVYPGVAMFAAMEPHRDRVAPHFHALLGGLGSDVAAAVERGRTAGRGTLQGAVGRPYPSSASIGSRHATELLWEAWYLAHGMARLEAVDGNGSALYVAKYSLKGGDDVPWWAIWEPGQLRNEWVEATQRRGGRGRSR